MKKILIIEDDPTIRSGLADDFRFEGYEVEAVRTGREGLAKGLTGQFDLILLDLMLPEMGGLEVCKELRSRRIGTPIIMLTAKSQDFDIVLGLELGADDYVTKPFSPFELRARVKAMLRRTGAENGSPGRGVIETGPFRIDEGRHEFWFNDRRVHLTSIEFEIVMTLMGRSGQVVKRDDMLNLAWGEDVLVTQRSVDTHISNIRRKIGDDADQPRWIISIRGIGYKLISG